MRSATSPLSKKLLFMLCRLIRLKLERLLTGENSYTFMFHGGIAFIAYFFRLLVLSKRPDLNEWNAVLISTPEI